MKTTIIGLILVALLLGCTTVGVEDIAMLDSGVQAFIAEHPNADITVNLISENDLNQYYPLMEEQCGRILPSKDYYLAKVTDPDSGLNLTVWIEKESQDTVCAFQEGSTSTVADTSQETIPEEETSVGDDENVDLPELPLEGDLLCTDSDEGTDYYYKGVLNINDIVLEDYCWQDSADSPKEEQYKNFLREYSCTPPATDNPNVEGYGGSKDTGYYEINYNCLGGCENGRCKNEFCTDFDGKDYYAYEVAQGYPDTIETTIYDCCTSSLTERDCQNRGNYLSEAICEGNDPSFENVECEFGCANGACIEIICTDSDGGYNIDNKGITSGTWIDDGTYITRTDTCQGDTLDEYFCNENDDVTFGIHNCPDGCVDGACIELVPDINSSAPENALEIYDYVVSVPQIGIDIRNISDVPIAITNITILEGLIEYPQYLIGYRDPGATYSYLLDVNQCGYSNNFSFDITIDYMDEAERTNSHTETYFGIC